MPRKIPLQVAGRRHSMNGGPAVGREHQHTTRTKKRAECVQEPGPESGIEVREQRSDPDEIKRLFLNRDLRRVVSGVDRTCAEGCGAEVNGVAGQIAGRNGGVGECRLEVAQHATMAARQIQDAPHLGCVLLGGVQALLDTSQG